MTAILRSLVSSGEFLFRSGGDEFILLLPATDLEGGLRLREAIQNRIDRADVLPAGAGKIAVTVAACEHEAGEGQDRFMRRAEVTPRREPRERTMTPLAFHR